MYPYPWPPQGIDMVACGSTHSSILQSVSLSNTHLNFLSFLSVFTLYVYLNSKKQLQYLSWKQCASTLVGSELIRKPSCVMVQMTNVEDYQARGQFNNTSLSYCIPLGTAGRYSSVNPRSILLPILHGGEGKYVGGGWEIERDGKKKIKRQQTEVSHRGGMT